MAIKKFSELPNRTQISPAPDIAGVRLVATSGTGDTAINLNVPVSDVLSTTDGKYVQLTAENQTITGTINITEDLVVNGTFTSDDILMREAQVYVTNVTPSVLVSGYVYDLGVLASNQNLANIAFASVAGYVQTCEIWAETGDTPYSITWPNDTIWPDGEAVTTLATNTRYRFAVRREGNGTLVITRAYEYSV